MTKFQALLAAFAVVYGCGVKAGTVDKYRSESGAECTAAYEDNHKFEFGFEGSDGASVGSGGLAGLKPFAKYTFTFGGDSNRNRLNCVTTQSLEEQRMKLTNERLRLELEMLRIQVEAQKNAGKEEVTVTSTGDDDKW